MSGHYDNTSSTGRFVSLVSSHARAVSLGDLPEPPEWMGGALCAQTDPDIFFPEKGGTTEPAKRVCAACDVRERCLAYAVERDERFGIWGGLSERARRKLRIKARKDERA